MDRHEAQYVLQAYRPDGSDLSDPVFTEALAYLKQDPELSQWFEEEQCLSAALTAKLQEIQPPASLRRDILAARKVTQLQQRFRRRVWFAMAAAVVFLAALIGWQLNQFRPVGPATYEAYREDMGNYLSSFFLLDLQTDDKDAIRAWLTEKHGFVDYEVPAALDQYDSVGCELIPWHGREIALICFDAHGELVHLFISPKGSIPGWPDAAGENMFAQVDEWTTTSWSDAENTFLVSTLGTRAFLEGALTI